MVEKLPWTHLLEMKKKKKNFDEDRKEAKECR